jgi:membrane protease YdiL (CAAX protease family)
LGSCFIHKEISVDKSLEFLKRHSLVTGIVLMFLITWPIDLANSGILPFQPPLPVSLFLGWGFIFASLIMTGLTLGRDSVIALLKRYLQWRVGWKWYLAAIALIPALWIAGVYLYAALTQVPLDFSSILAYQLFGKTANPVLFMVPFFLIDLIANGEEMGWRGYVLPRLQAKHNALASSLILGLIWGLWHLPKFLSHFDAAAFAWFMLHILAFAVIMTWLYNSTKGSLLLVALCHAASNTAGIFLPVANTISGENMGAYITIVLLEVAAAVVITLSAGSARLSRSEQMETVDRLSGQAALPDSPI